jgi:hypothetical protein
MQIAEVELLPYEEITSISDAVSVTLPPGAQDVRGVAMLFDHQLGPTRKFEVAPISGIETVVDITPAAGATVLKGFELIGAADDLTYPERTPSSVRIAGSNDGIDYTDLAAVGPAYPSSDLQIQEFATLSNNTAFARYRITFLPPVVGDRMQVGEMRLFGEIVRQVLSIRAAGTNVLVSWPDSPGFNLEAKTSLSNATWNLIGASPALSNGVRTATLPRTGNASFFRLRK